MLSARTSTGPWPRFYTLPRATRVSTILLARSGSCHVPCHPIPPLPSLDRYDWKVECEISSRAINIRLVESAGPDHSISGALHTPKDPRNRRIAVVSISSSLSLNLP